LGGKKVLDIGCGSGHSLKWCGEHGAEELWGLDISENQLANTQKLLTEGGYAPRLFCSPMEQNPGIPQGYFDVVYSIYAIGWTVDLQATFDLIAAYLKPGGTFIFSWEHPLMRRVETANGKLILNGNYNKIEQFYFEKAGQQLMFYLRRISDYVNALAASGLYVMQIVEETERKTQVDASEYSPELYAPWRAKRLPLSLIVKARKL
jgi:ubiquinone/menaquinone biosynthesis C-methylase UbiE